MASQLRNIWLGKEKNEMTFEQEMSSFSHPPAVCFAFTPSHTTLVENKFIVEVKERERAKEADKGAYGT